MGFFTKKPSGEKAVVKFIRTVGKEHKTYGFLTLGDGRDVYFNDGHLAASGIAKLDVGQEVHVTHAPSEKKPGTLQVVSISA